MHAYMRACVCVGYMCWGWDVWFGMLLPVKRVVFCRRLHSQHRYRPRLRRLLLTRVLTVNELLDFDLLVASRLDLLLLLLLLLALLFRL